ncbi:MAG: hypothetical protein H6745_22980 [Deltaproteobacteria bacterium]|nr:hypothetical protein [Deltaproteobacteria bacterium]
MADDATEGSGLAGLPADGAGDGAFPEWGRVFALSPGETGRVRVGPLEMTIARKEREWRVGLEQDPDPLRGDFAAIMPDPGLELPDAKILHRFAVADPSPELTLTPRLADRSVVVRPARPFWLLAGDELEVFMSTPIWLAMTLLPKEQVVLDVPTSRPSDTWFGTSTREGELCYASRTAARLELADVPHRAARALSVVLLRNRASEPVSLERLHLPAPQLELFTDAAGRLWTQAIELELGGPDAGELRFVPGPPPAAGDAVPIGAPRRPQARRQLLVRALSGLWT